MTDTLPGVESKVAVSVVQDIADGGASIRWDWVVSDLSVNYAGPQGLLPSAGDCSGRAQQPMDYAGGWECAGPVFLLGRAVPAGGTSHTLHPAGKPGGGESSSGYRSPMAANHITSGCIGAYPNMIY